MLEVKNSVFEFPNLLPDQLESVIVRLKTGNKLAKDKLYALSPSQLVSLFGSTLDLIDAADYLQVSLITGFAATELLFLLNEFTERLISTPNCTALQSFIVRLVELCAQPCVQGSIMELLRLIILEAASCFPELFLSGGMTAKVAESLLFSDAICFDSEDSFLNYVLGWFNLVAGGGPDLPDLSEAIPVFNSVRYGLLSTKSLRKLSEFWNVLPATTRAIIEAIQKEATLSTGFLNGLLTPHLCRKFPDQFKPRVDQPVCILLALDTGTQSARLHVIPFFHGQKRCYALSAAVYLHLVGVDNSPEINAWICPCSELATNGVNSNLIFIAVFSALNNRVAGFCLCLATLQMRLVPELLLVPQSTPGYAESAAKRPRLDPIAPIRWASAYLPDFPGRRPITVGAVYLPRSETNTGAEDEGLHVISIDQVQCSLWISVHIFDPGRWVWQLVKETCWDKPPQYSMARLNVFAQATRPGVGQENSRVVYASVGSYGAHSSLISLGPISTDACTPGQALQPRELAVAPFNLRYIDLIALRVPTRTSKRDSGRQADSIQCQGSGPHPPGCEPNGAEPRLLLFPFGSCSRQVTPLLGRCFDVRRCRWRRWVADRSLSGSTRQEAAHSSTASTLTSSTASTITSSTASTLTSSTTSTLTSATSSAMRSSASIADASAITDIITAVIHGATISASASTTGRQYTTGAAIATSAVATTGGGSSGRNRQVSGSTVDPTISLPSANSLDSDELVISLPQGLSEAHGPICRTRMVTGVRLIEFRAAWAAFEAAEKAGDADKDGNRALLRLLHASEPQSRLGFLASRLVAARCFASNTNLSGPATAVAFTLSSPPLTTTPTAATATDAAGVTTGPSASKLVGATSASTVADSFAATSLEPSSTSTVNTPSAVAPFAFTAVTPSSTSTTNFSFTSGSTSIAVSADVIEPPLFTYLKPSPIFDVTPHTVNDLSSITSEPSTTVIISEPPAFHLLGSDSVTTNRCHGLASSPTLSHFAPASTYAAMPNTATAAQFSAPPAPRPTVGTPAPPFCGQSVSTPVVSFSNVNTASVATPPTDGTGIHTALPDTDCLVMLGASCCCRCSWPAHGLETTALPHCQGSGVRLYDPSVRWPLNQSMERGDASRRLAPGTESASDLGSGRQDDCICRCQLVSDTSTLDLHRGIWRAAVAMANTNRLVRVPDGELPCFDLSGAEMSSITPGIVDCRSESAADSD